MKFSKNSLKALLLTTALLTQPSFSKQYHDDAANDSLNQKYILDKINSYRYKHGLRALTIDNFISKEAENHSRALAENRVPYGHGGFNLRVSHLRCQFHQCHAFAENVAYSTGEAKEVVQQWLDSQPHRENIEGNYNLTGIGIAHSSNGKVYVTQLFLRKS